VNPKFPVAADGNRKLKRYGQISPNDRGVKIFYLEESPNTTGQGAP